MASAGSKADNLVVSGLGITWHFSISQSSDLHDSEHGGTRYARPVAEAPGITMIMIVAAIVGMSLCVIQSWCLALQDDLDAARIDITALINGRVETPSALCSDNVTAN
jgi:hypothetical protein